MPISTISQIISTLPEAGRRGVDVQTQFVIKQEDFQDHLQGTTVAELNALKTQINTTVTGMNIAVETVNTKASEASTSASSASTSASQCSTFSSEASASASSASASATKAGQWADANYNVQVETGKYSAKHWSTVAQDTVTNKVDKVTSTDNAIPRFDGTTGNLQNSGVIIDDNGNLGVGSSPFAKLSTLGTNNAIAETIFMAGISGVTNGFTVSKDSAANPNYKFYTTSGTIGLEIDGGGNVLLKSGTGGLGYGPGAGGTVTQLTSKSTAVTLNKPSGTITMNNAALAASSSVAFRLYNSLCSNGDVCVIAPTDGNYSVIGIVENGSVYIRVTNITASTLSDVFFVKYTIIKGVTA